MMWRRVQTLGIITIHFKNFAKKNQEEKGTLEKICIQVYVPEKPILHSLLLPVLSLHLPQEMMKCEHHWLDTTNNYPTEACLYHLYYLYLYHHNKLHIYLHFTHLFFKAS